MKIRLPLLTLFLSLIFASCKEEELDYSVCQEGTIIGRIRSAGGGPAVSVQSGVFGDHSWGGHENVVEALNLPPNLASGTKIYFKARPASQEEKTFIVSADGDESAKPIIYMIAVSTEACP